MSRIIVITGRGGTGKSTFAALLAKHLPAPPLLIDADPDQSLAQLLGVDLAKAGIHTISDVLYKLQKPDQYQDLSSMRLSEKIEYLLNTSCLYESDKFDLMALGVKWTRGCYCAPNDILKSVIPRLARDYPFTIVDSPAGLEHVNRRVVEKVNDVFAVLDPSAKALRNTRLLVEIAEAIGLAYQKLYAVGNFRVNQEQEAALKALDGATYLGRILPDPEVERRDWQGQSLLELPNDSPACASVRQIVRAAGYLDG